jgi:hypothetical protein
MIWMTILFSALFAVSGIGVILLIQRLTRVDPRPGFTVEELSEISAERYRPMLRLLSDDDLRFLSMQPGFTGRMASELRRQRCQIFRGYLRCLQGDFRRITMALRILLLQSKYDRPDLASVLVQSELRFLKGIALARVELTLFSWGIGTVNVDGLLGLFDVMHAELTRMAAVTGTSNA